MKTVLFLVIFALCVAGAIIFDQMVAAPPAHSVFYGAYAFGPLRENSSDFPWWVVLAKK